MQYSPVRIERLTEFHLGWQQQLGDVNFDGLNPEGRVDYIALRNRIEYDLEVLRLEEQRGAEIAPLVPFGDTIRLLQETRHDRIRVDPAKHRDRTRPHRR